MAKNSLVSCLCVTRDRVRLLRRAVECFFAQTYEPRELVVVFESDDFETRAFLEQFDSPQLLAVEVPVRPKLTLGALRNIALRSGSGNYIAQWDDDDWYAPSRLQEQIQSLRFNHCSGCVLLRWTMFDHLTQRAYVSSKRPWEGSLVAHRASVPPYPDLPRLEDTPVLMQMLDEGKLVGLDRPELYIYTYHGQNTWDRAHWEDELVPFATPIEYSNAAWIRNAVNSIAVTSALGTKDKVLFIWEQGASLGHLANLRIPIEVALAQGYAVVLAARELSRLHEVFGDLPLTAVQAPFSEFGQTDSATPVQSFSQLLGEQCFGSKQELYSLLVSWSALYAQIAPKFILVEHSPTALLAAYRMAIPTMQIGTGFTIPPWSLNADCPFAPFEGTDLSEQEQLILRRYDLALLSQINEVGKALRSPAIRHIGEIFPPPNRSFLLTWPELDHFGGRKGVQYFGPGGSPPSHRPEWSVHPGPKLFVYLQNFPSAEALLRDVKVSGANALVYIKNLPATVVKRYQGAGMQFVEHLVDLQAVARQALCAITHGSHNTSSSLFAAGLPQLLIPLHQEQWMFGMRLVRQGCAAMAFQDQSSYQTAIRALLNNEGLHANARELGGKLPVYDEARLRSALVEAFA